MNKWMIIITLSIGTIALISACKSTKSAVVKEDSTEKEFSLAKGACFGSCPVYTLTINKGGFATYQGLAYSKMMGIYTKKLAKDKYKNLKKAFAKSDFDKYPTDFESNIPDLPMVTVGYNNGDGLKEVRGRIERPEDLMQLQFLLEKVIDSGGWELVKSAEEIESEKKPAPSIIYSEIIIEPKPGLLMARWIESMDKYGVRLIKKLAPALDLYLITYTHDTIKPKDFLKVLHDDPEIINAHFNQKTTKRGGR